VLTRLSTQVRTMMRMLLARHGWECPHRDLLGERGQLWLEGVELEGNAGKMLAALREILVVIQAKADEFERLVEQVSSAHPAAQRLRTIPGIGPFLSLALAVEIGDMADFPREAAFATYCGVTPLKRRSGVSRGSARLSRFTNKRLLRAVTQAALTAATHHAESRLYYQKKLAGRSDPRTKTLALIALARHRARRLYKVLRRASLPSAEVAA
jgi:transposase